MASEFNRDDPQWVEVFAAIQPLLSKRIESLAQQGLDPDLVAKEILAQLSIGFQPADSVQLEEDGYLPASHVCSLDTIERLFGNTTPRRIQLFTELQTIVDLARRIKAKRLLLNGSFVTSKPIPSDIDVALWVPNFPTLLASNSAPVVQLMDISCNTDESNLTQLYVESTERAWWGWWRLFSQVQSPFVSRVYKGLVEVRL